MKKIILSLIVLAVAVSLRGIAYAQGFTNASFKGNYAINVTAGTRIAGLGTAIADGIGNFTGFGIERIWNKRRFEINIEGTYSVNANGMGTANSKITTEDGQSGELKVDFVIMQAEVVNGVKLATEIFAVASSEGVFGNPPVYTYKRLPD